LTQKIVKQGFKLFFDSQTKVLQLKTAK